MLAEGISCGLHRIERLMRLQGLKALPRSWLAQRRIEAALVSVAPMPASPEVLSWVRSRNIAFAKRRAVA
jgi:transposase InsO family protein